MLNHISTPCTSDVFICRFRSKFRAKVPTPASAHLRKCESMGVMRVGSARRECENIVVAGGVAEKDKHLPIRRPLRSLGRAVARVCQAFWRAIVDGHDVQIHAAVVAAAT